MNPSLENYIKQARQTGRTDEIIRQELKTGGWTDGDISQAFQVQSSINNSGTPPTITKQNSKTYKYSYLILGVLLVVYATWNMLGWILIALHANGYCTLGFHPYSKFFADFIKFFTPIAYLYSGLVFWSVSRKEEKPNIIIRISFSLMLLIILLFLSPFIPTLSYVFMSLIYNIKYFYIVFMSLPLLIFILLLIGNFRIKFIIISIIIPAAVFAGAYFLERSKGCDSFEFSKAANETFDPDVADLSSCDDLTDPNFKAQCYFTAAENKNDATLCDSLPKNELNDRYNRYECYSSVAWKNGNAQICDLLKDKPDKFQGCIIGASQRGVDYESCKFITDPFQKDQCIGSAAVNRKDVRICDLVSTSSHNGCVANFANKTRDCELLVNLDKGDYHDYYHACLYNTGQKK